ncbi:MAG: hypothetical protein Kapaf2KO_23650 [Candidatus Kapaibacteriales bacterium]
MKLDKSRLKYLGLGLAKVALLGLLHSFVTSAIAWTYQKWFDIFINSDSDSLNRAVQLEKLEGTDISFLTVFINPQNINSSQVKNIDINLFNELYLPFAIFLLVGSYFFKDDKRNILKLSFILLFILWFKNILIVYDNYTYPEFALVELPTLFSGIVYYFNSLVANVGQSLSLMIASIFCVVIIAQNLGNVLVNKSDRK